MVDVRNEYFSVCFPIKYILHNYYKDLSDKSSCGIAEKGKIESHKTKVTLMKVYNVGLIGRGKMGKAFQGEIEKSNKFNLVKIFSKRDIRKKKQNIRKFFRSNRPFSLWKIS